MNNKSRSIQTIFCLIFTIFLTSSCTIHLVSDYDAEMDKGVTGVQKQVEAIFGKLNDCVDPATNVCKKPSSTYSADDYKKIRNEMSVLIVRSEAVSHNQETTRALYLLANSICEGAPKPPANLGVDLSVYPKITLQARQNSSVGMPIDIIRDAHTLINTQFRAILTYELAKKSGAEAASSK